MAEIAMDPAPVTDKQAFLIFLRGCEWTYQEIAYLCHVKVETVQANLRSARKPLGATTEAEAIAEAVKRGIINLTGERPEPERRPVSYASTDDSFQWEQNDAGEEQRIAELDWAWQQIRKERPNAPADWRVL